MLAKIYCAGVIPAFESGIKGRLTFRYWRELQRSQWKPPAELRELQLVALRNLLLHASTNCLYYRESWRQLGLKPDRIEAADDFERWPLVDREAIRRNGDYMAQEHSVTL